MVRKGRRRRVWPLLGLLGLAGGSASLFSRHNESVVAARAQDQPLFNWTLDLHHYLQHNQVTDIHFIQKVHELSFEMQQRGLSLNVLVIGACDGTHDRLIYDLLNPENLHWRGHLVEPITRNYRDLVSNVRNASQRVKTYQYAITDQCPHETVNMSNVRVRPEAQDKYPHWFTREIASLDPNVTLIVRNFARTPANLRRIAGLGAANTSVRVDVNDFEWANEAVACLTGSLLMSRLPTSDWIHVVKVDAEGRDFLILLTLLKFFVRYRARGERRGVMKLPLLILIENKFLNDDQRRRILAATTQLGYESTFTFAPLGQRQHRLNTNDVLFFQPSWTYSS